MSDAAVPVVRVPDEVPTSAWALGLSCLAGEVLQLAIAGPTDSALSVLLSVPVNVLLYVWVSYGVLTARGGRTLFAWIVLAIEVVLGTVGLLADPSGPGALSLLTTLAAIASLAALTRTDHHAWRSDHPKAPGPSLAGLLVLAGLVGVLAGVIDHSPDRGSDSGFQMHVGS